MDKRCFVTKNLSYSSISISAKASPYYKNKTANHSKFKPKYISECQPYFKTECKESILDENESLKLAQSVSISPFPLNDVQLRYEPKHKF